MSASAQNTYTFPAAEEYLLPPRYPLPVTTAAHGDAPSLVTPPALAPRLAFWHFSVPGHSVTCGFPAAQGGLGVLRARCGYGALAPCVPRQRGPSIVSPVVCGQPAPAVAVTCIETAPRSPPGSQTCSVLDT